MNILNGLSGKADTLGYLAGVVAGSPNGIADIASSVQQLIAGVIHAPDPLSLQSWFSEPQFMNGLMAYIGGIAVDALKLPVVGKYGKAIEKGGQAYLIASFLNKVLYSMTHSDLKGENVLNTQRTYERAVVEANSALLY